MLGEDFALGVAVEIAVVELSLREVLFLTAPRYGNPLLFGDVGFGQERLQLLQDGFLSEERCTRTVRESRNYFTWNWS